MAQKFKCSMQKKIESFRTRAEDINDVINNNAAKAGRYGKAQNVLNYNRNNDQSRQVHEFLVQYIPSKYGVEWSDTVSDQHKFWFKDKGKAQEFVDVLVKYADLPAKDVTMGRSVGNFGRTNPRVGWYIFKAFKSCPEWKADFQEFINGDIREPIASLKNDVERERSVTPEQKKFNSDLEDFKDELSDVIRNALKLSVEVTYYPHGNPGDDNFAVMVDHNGVSDTSKSITNVVNRLVRKNNTIPGGKSVDLDAAAETLADLENALG